MKYLSLLIFTALASWTWNLIHSDPLGHVIPHDAIQAKMRQFIEEKVKSENANLSEFQLQSLWSVEVDKVAVYVLFSFCC
ncbi:MAG: hypothetical protein AB7O96_17990, partial [Pseudobdellovibrionaceae bacterium]